jgi:hypothetical protein
MSLTKEASLAMCYTNETMESSGSEEEIEEIDHRNQKSNFVRILRESMTNALFRGNSTRSLNKSSTLYDKKDQNYPWDLTVVKDSLLETVIPAAMSENAVLDYHPENNATSTAVGDKTLVLDEHHLNQTGADLQLESVSTHSFGIDRSCYFSIQKSLSFDNISPIPTVTCCKENDMVLFPSIRYDSNSNREEEEGRERNNAHYPQNFTDEDKDWIEQNFFIITENSIEEGGDDSSYESLFNDTSGKQCYGADFLSEQQHQQQGHQSSLVTSSSTCFGILSTAHESWQCSQSSPFPEQIFFPSINLEIKRLISCSSTESSEFSSSNSHKRSSEFSDGALEDCIHETNEQPTAVPNFVSTQGDRDNSSELTLDHDKDDNNFETKEEEAKAAEKPPIILLPSSHDTPAAIKHSPRRNFLSRMYSNKKKKIIEEETMHFLKSCEESKLASTFLWMKDRNEKIFQESDGLWPSTTSAIDYQIWYDETETDGEPWLAFFD